MAFDPPDMAPVGMDNKVIQVLSVNNVDRINQDLFFWYQVKIGLQMRPKDELYIFVYDKNQIYIPSVSRVYGSDFRKISDVGG